jgi:hypothetical protein
MKKTLLAAAVCVEFLSSAHANKTPLTALPEFFLREISELMVQEERAGSFLNHESHSPHISLEMRKRLVEKGRFLLHAIAIGESLVEKNEIFTSSFFAQKSQTNPQSMAKLENIIAIVWALAEESSRQGNLFKSGSFSVDDPRENLFNIFIDYVTHIANRSPYHLPKGALNAFNPRGNNRVYNRSPDTFVPNSSHYSNQTRLQLGIDMRFDKGASCFPALPYGALHLLVGRVTTKTGIEKTFVKFEENGTGDIKSTLRHSVDFVRSLAAQEGRRCEKDLNDQLVASFRSFGQKMAEINTSCGNCNSRTESMLKKPKELVSLSYLRKHQDVSSLYLFAKDIYENSPHKEARFAAFEFMQMLDAIYRDGEKIHYRTGNEVVMQLIEFLNNGCVQF